MPPKPRRSHIARATVVLTMDDGSRAVYLLEGGPDCEVSVDCNVNSQPTHDLLTHSIDATYDYRFELLNMSSSEVQTEQPEQAAIEALAREITSADGPAGP